MAWLKAPEGATIVHLGEKAFDVIKGVFEVEDEHIVAELHALGFEHGNAPEVEPEKKASKAKKAAESGDA